MNVNIRDLIEYEVRGGYIPNNIPSLKTISIIDEFYIPSNKPNIKEITRIKASIRTKKGVIIKTAKGKSLEGKVLTGLKYQIYVDFLARVEYLPDLIGTTLMTFDYKKSTVVYVPIEENSKLDDTFIESSFIEDISLNLINERKITLGISAFIIIENRDWS